MTEPIRVDVWSDIACPWCYIGKRNLEAGIALTREDDVPPEVEVIFHSFELAPDTPVDFDGGEEDYLAAHKGITRAQATEMIRNVTEVARSAGLEYRYDLLKHTNTVKAHELMHFAKAHGKQAEMNERLLKAYFIEGRHLGRPAELADLAAAIGLDRAEALAALEAGRHHSDVRFDQKRASALGINGVPFYVINEKYGVSGAQSPETFAQVLRQVAGVPADAS